MLPTRDHAIELLKIHTTKSFHGILKHCLAVERLCDHMTTQIECNREIVRIAAILHDIGRHKYPPKSKDAIRHAVEGASILRKLQIDEKVCKITENHIGAGILINDILKQNLPLEIKDYIPLTIEEKIVAYADNCVSYDKIQDVHYPIERFSKSLGIEYGNRVIKLHNELVEMGYKTDYHEKPVTELALLTVV